MAKSKDEPVADAPVVDAAPAPEPMAEPVPAAPAVEPAPVATGSENSVVAAGPIVPEAPAAPVAVEGPAGAVSTDPSVPLGDTGEHKTVSGLTVKTF